jgi:tetratricopeptide (TPR) repeat protein
MASIVRLMQLTFAHAIALTLCTGHISFADTVPRSPASVGELIVIWQPCAIIEGPDAGKKLLPGLVAECSQIKGDRIWISGPCSGWVSSDNVVVAVYAENMWINSIKRRPINPRIVADVAYIQLRCHRRKSAQETISTIGPTEKQELYVRLIAAIVEVSKDMKRSDDEAVVALIHDSKMSDELASTIISGLRSIGRRDLMYRVIASLKLDELHASADYLIGVAENQFESKDNPKEALRLIQSIIKRDQFYVQPRLTRAWILNEQGQGEDAIAELNQCLKFSPENSDVLMLLGTYLVAAGRVDLGLTKIDKGIALRPNDHAAMFMAGRSLLAYAMSDKDAKPDSAVLEKSAKLFKKACELTDYNRMTYVQILCVTYVQQGKHEAALDLVKRETRRIPSNDARQEVLKQLNDYITANWLERWTKKQESLHPPRKVSRDDKKLDKH